MLPICMTYFKIKKNQQQRMCFYHRPHNRISPWCYWAEGNFYSLGWKVRFFHLWTEIRNHSYITAFEAQWKIICAKHGNWLIDLPTSLKLIRNIFLVLGWENCRSMTNWICHTIERIFLKSATGKSLVITCKFTNIFNTLAECKYSGLSSL